MSIEPNEDTPLPVAKDWTQIKMYEAVLRTEDMLKQLTKAVYDIQAEQAQDKLRIQELQRFRDHANFAYIVPAWCVAVSMAGLFITAVVFCFLKMP